MIVKIHKSKLTHDTKLKYVVICVKVKEKFLFARHKDRLTWEFAGGHIELVESPREAAIRELFEETGIKNQNIEAVCDYEVQNNNETTLGRLYYLLSDEMAVLPGFEMAENRLFENFPDNLTYPEIYKVLFAQIDIFEKTRVNHTNVYFVRHAKPDASIKDDRIRPLTEKGMEDTRLVTEVLSGKKVEKIYSSPYKRAYDTVNDFAQKNRLEISILEGFRERKVEDVWIDDFKTFSLNQWNDFDFKLHKGECLREVQERNIYALKEVLKENPGRSVAVGSHGTALSTIINYFDSDFKYEGFWSIIDKMPLIICFKFHNNEFLGMEEIFRFEPY